MNNFNEMDCADSHTPFTIVTLVKNDVNGLRKTRESLENQNCTHWKHLIVYGKSVDTTFELVHEISQRDDRTLVFFEKQSGIYPNMNFALENIDYPTYINFLNAGDYLYSSSSLSKISRILKNDMTWLSGGFMHEYEDGVMTCPLTQEFSLVNQTHAWRYHSHQSVFFHSGFLEKCDKFDEKFEVAADWDFMCRLFFISPPVYLKEPQIIFSIGGFSSSRIELAHQELSLLRSRYLKQSMIQSYLSNYWLKRNRQSKKRELRIDTFYFVFSKINFLLSFIHLPLPRNLKSFFLRAAHVFFGGTKRMFRLTQQTISWRVRSALLSYLDLHL